MDAMPPDGINPIDKWQDRRMAGQPAEYYLVYFGRQAPLAWPFELYKEGLRDGLTFRVDVIDTWNMTVTSFPGTFTIRKKDPYVFADSEGRSIALPGKPYVALRIERVAD
jgi:hypothetical protein